MLNAFVYFDFEQMWTVFSVYASVGMVLFGGKITTNSTVLMNSEFGRANYYSNNFNDFASSLVTLFELLVVNNWHVLMNGFVLVTNAYYRWYFISFWTIAVVVILNLVIAFVLEAFFAKDKEGNGGSGSNGSGGDGDGSSGSGRNSSAKRSGNGDSEPNVEKIWCQFEKELKGSTRKEGNDGIQKTKYTREDSVINLHDGFK